MLLEFSLLRVIFTNTNRYSPLAFLSDKTIQDCVVFLSQSQATCKSFQKPSSVCGDLEVTGNMNFGLIQCCFILFPGKLGILASEIKFHTLVNYAWN